MSASSDQPRILIFLPVHDRRATTELFIKCLETQSYSNWHLVLIDDGSRDGTEAMVRERVGSLTVIRGKGKWWWGGALHQGYRWLKREKLFSDDLVLIVNDDTQFEDDFLYNAVQAMQPHSLLLAQQYDQTGNFVEAGIAWNWSRLDWRVVKDGDGINCFPTRGLFLWAHDFLRIGGFHPVILPHYLSDYEFTMRAHRKGFGLITSKNVRLWYDENLTGIRRISEKSVMRRIKLELSVKCANNPVYWTSFILIACPFRYIPINIAIVWKRFLTPIVTQIRLNRMERRARRSG